MIELSPLEAAVSQRLPERLPSMLAALARLEGGEGFAGGLPLTEGCARLADALTTMLADPDLPLDEGAAWALQINGGTINALFAAGRRDLGRAREAIAPLSPGALPDLSPEVRRRILPLLTIDSPAPFSADDILALPSAEALLTALVLIGSQPVLTDVGAVRREALLNAAERLEGAPLQPRLLHAAVAAAAWMTCSYASGSRKHRLKAVLNDAFRHVLDATGFPQPPMPQPRPIRERPTMVVIAEVIRSGHVQYRYFGQYLRQLATRFRLVLVTPERELDEPVKPLFEAWHTFDAYGPARVLNGIRDFVLTQQPDIVFWPSVGMARWGPLLANLRLAPIQMTALGHSASTFCPAIDYYLTEEGYVGDPALLSEKLLLLPDESLVFERPPHYRPVAPELRERPDPLRVAIPSNVLKLNPHFLGVVQRIRAEAGRALELHVFPNGTPVRVEALRAASPFLGDAIVHPRASAEAYLQSLNRCDLVLSPFPFGGLHSVVDALRQGLPVVALEGAEPHARTDAMIIRRLGLPERLIARAEDEYVARALEIMEDDVLRLDIGRRALALDIDRLMFGDATTPLRNEVVETVWQAYLHHEGIMADPRRALRLSDLAALGGRG